MKEELLTAKSVANNIIKIDGLENQNDWSFSNGVYLTERNERPCYIFNGLNGLVDYIKIPYTSMMPCPTSDNCEIQLEYEVISLTGRVIPFSQNIMVVGYGGLLLFEESNRLLAYSNKITQYGEGIAPIGTHYSIPGEITTWDYRLDNSGATLKLNDVLVSNISNIVRFQNTTSFLIGNAFAATNQDPTLSNQYTARPCNWVLYKLWINSL